MARVVPRPCGHCGEIFHPGSNVEGRKHCSMACYNAARAARTTKRTCPGCNEVFEKPVWQPQKYCTRACWAANAHQTSQARREDVRDKISRARAKKGMQVGRRQRQLENAGFTLKDKGETRCRNCRSTERQLNLHHAIPRSMWRAGITNPLNGVPLCTVCHLGWHHRRVTIYRDVFTPEEWACLRGADLLGQDVDAWLDDRYPIRAVEMAA